MRPNTRRPDLNNIETAAGERNPREVEAQLQELRNIKANWLRVAKSRLRLELRGLALAMSRGAVPQEYARVLWGEGAVSWMGTASPDAQSYVLKEAAAIAVLFPWVNIGQGKMTPERAELLFSGGCLCGYGEDRWALARSLGLGRTDLCRYCSEAFQVWGQQLGLKVTPHPGRDNSCRLEAIKLDRGA
ncbi:MAG: hypothetical protein HY669_00315 [Chloroflexi bacterium]|nr:hypothetical protein [Chloroflexota bacterium]